MMSTKQRSRDFNIVNSYSLQKLLRSTLVVSPGLHNLLIFVFKNDFNK